MTKCQSLLFRDGGGALSGEKGNAVAVAASSGGASRGISEGRGHHIPLPSSQKKHRYATEKCLCMFSGFAE